jgi:Xaa-Pro aminopeptidase
VYGSIANGNSTSTSTSTSTNANSNANSTNNSNKNTPTPTAPLNKKRKSVGPAGEDEIEDEEEVHNKPKPEQIASPPTAPATTPTHIPISSPKIACIKSPIALLKSVKNAVELAGVRNSHIRDGVALTAFFHWLQVGTVKAKNRRA